MNLLFTKGHFCSKPEVNTGGFLSKYYKLWSYDHRVLVNTFEGVHQNFKWLLDISCKLRITYIGAGNIFQTNSFPFKYLLAKMKMSHVSNIILSQRDWKLKWKLGRNIGAGMRFVKYSLDRTGGTHNYE